MYNRDLDIWNPKTGVIFSNTRDKNEDHSLIQRLSCDQVGTTSSDASEVIRRVTAILAFAYHHFGLHLAKPLEVFGENLAVFLGISALRACYNTVIDESWKDSAEESGARRVFVGSAAIMAFGIRAQPPTEYRRALKH